MLDTILSITFTGQRVTAERSGDSPTGWCVTGWEKGLPVARKPITPAALAELMDRLPYVIRSVDTVA